MGIKKLNKKDRTSAKKRKQVILSASMAFELVVDPDNEAMQKLLALDEGKRKLLLDQALLDLVRPSVEIALKELNAGNSGWAVMRLANG